MSNTISNAFTCPRCERTSRNPHPQDIAWGYCGDCHRSGENYDPTLEPELKARLTIEDDDGILWPPELQLPKMH